MQDINYLIKVLGINGVNENSPVSAVENVLNSLRLTPDEQQHVLSDLKGRGWVLEGQTFAPATATMAPVPPQQATQAPRFTTMQTQGVPTLTPSSTPSPKKSGIAGALIALILVLVAGGGVAYAFFQKIGPFSEPVVYNESNLFSKLLDTSSRIKSSKYVASVDLNVVNREADAKPFVLTLSNQAELDKYYANDYTRSNDISAILGQLRRYGSGSGYYGQASKPYPSSIKNIFTSAVSYYSYTTSKPSLNDPVTKAPYEYKVTDNGNNFTLTVNFETDLAVKSVITANKFSDQKNGTTTDVSGKRIVFTKDSYTYLFISKEPPKPYLMSIADMTRSLSPETKFSTSVTAASQWSSDTVNNWTFNFDATGSMGDLSYKVNADVLKKDSDYYLRVNNIPSIFGNFSMFKGKWISVNSLASSTSVYGSMLSAYTTGLPKFEEKYKADRAKTTKLLRIAAEAADEVGVIAFKENPRSEKVGDRDLVRYSIKMKKDNLLAFFTKFNEKVHADPNLIVTKSLFDDQGLKEYLQSEEFNQTFDYVDKNTTLTFWIDHDGNPAIIEYDMRVVPPDTALQLKDKQINIALKLQLKDINQPVNIEAPKDSMPIDELSKQLKANAGSSAF